MKKVLQALTLALTLSLFGGAAIANEGTFKLSDYGDGFDDPENYCWRGFAFQVGEEVSISSLIFSVGEVSQERGLWQAAVYTADVFDESTVLSELLGSVESTEIGEDMSAELEEIVMLEPNQWYVIAQGRVSGDDDHGHIMDFDSSDILSSQELITAWGNVESDELLAWDCDITAEQVLLSPESGTTSTIPGLGFVYGARATVDPLFAQDARLNALVDACRRNFVETIQGQKSPSLSQYLGCIFTDVNKGNVDKVNSAILAEYKASITAGKTMTSADIYARVQFLAQRYTVLDRLVATPYAVYIDDLINIGLTELKNTSSRYRAITSIRNFSDSTKGDYAALEREIAQLTK